MPSASSKSSQVSQPVSAGDLLQEPLKAAVSVAEKKLRNLEKRKLKILETKKKADQGAELNEDQKKALESLKSLDSSLEAVKDVQKNLATLETDYAKQYKKEQKRIKQEQKDQIESKSTRIVLNVVEIQALLGELSEDIRPDFLSGANGACQLSEKDFENLDTIYEMINPAASDDKDKKLTERVKTSGENLLNLAEARNKEAFDGVTYKEIRDILLKIQASGYFDRDTTNVASEVPEEEERPVDVIAEPIEEPSSPDSTPDEEYPQSSFQESQPLTIDTNVPLNGVDLPPEVQETPESEKLNFMGESEISPASGEPQSLNPVSPEFVPRNIQGSDDNGRQEDNWHQVDNGQGHQGSGNYRNRGGGRGRGGGGGRGGGRGGRGGGGSGNYRGGPREGGYRGNQRGGRGGRGGNREGGFRGGPRDGNSRGGNRGGRGGRGGGGSGGPPSSSGGFGNPN